MVTGEEKTMFFIFRLRSTVFNFKNDICDENFIGKSGNTDSWGARDESNSPFLEYTLFGSIREDLILLFFFSCFLYTSIALNENFPGETMSICFSLASAWRQKKKWAELF